MNILFSTSHFGFLRNFQSTLRMLAERGHRLHLVADRKESMGGVEMIDDLLRDYPGSVTYEYVPVRKNATWYALTVGLRLSIDYWRYAGHDHLSVVFPGSPVAGDLVGWTRARLAGTTPEPGCRTAER